MAGKSVRVTHLPSGTVLAEGPIGWGITPFEGNLYIRHKYLRSDGLRVNWLPGFCFYKFLYVWLDFHFGEGERSRMIGWKYVLPNPIFPFIWFRVGLPRHHPELLVEEFERESADVGV
jgi:hypothetical protein